MRQCSIALKPVASILTVLSAAGRRDVVRSLYASSRVLPKPYATH